MRYECHEVKRVICRRPGVFEAKTPFEWQCYALSSWHSCAVQFWVYGNLSLNRCIPTRHLLRQIKETVDYSCGHAATRLPKPRSGDGPLPPGTASRDAAPGSERPRRSAAASRDAYANDSVGWPPPVPHTVNSCNALTDGWHLWYNPVVTTGKQSEKWPVLETAGERSVR